jgi:hypothetical protein
MGDVIKLVDINGNEVEVALSQILEECVRQLPLNEGQHRAQSVADGGWIVLGRVTDLP